MGNRELPKDLVELADSLDGRSDIWEGEIDEIVDKIRAHRCGFTLDDLLVVAREAWDEGADNEAWHEGVGSIDFEGDKIPEPPNRDEYLENLRKKLEEAQ